MPSDAVVILRGNQALDRNYWTSTSWPTLGSDGGITFNRDAEQFIDGGERALNPGTYGYTVTTAFQFRGSVGMDEVLFDAGSGYGQDSFVFYRCTTGSTLEVLYNIGTGPYSYPCFSSPSLSQSTTYIATMIYTPADGAATLYVNGVLASSITGIPNLGNRTVRWTRIGKPWPGYGNVYLNGAVYFTSIHDRSLSSSEILQQHQCWTACTPCPAGSYCPSAGAPATFTCMSGYTCGSVVFSVVTVPCPVNSYCPSTGLSSPIACPTGTSANKTGMTACVLLSDLPGKINQNITALTYCLDHILIITM
jgi:hypothetical protein